jgi:hypothetical protein
MKIAHVPFDEPSDRSLLRRDADECRVEIDAIHLETLLAQQSRVLAGAAGHIQDASTPRIEATQHARDLCRFGRVILERRVDQIVEIRRRGEHFKPQERAADDVTIQLTRPRTRPNQPTPPHLPHPPQRPQRSCGRPRRAQTMTERAWSSGIANAVSPSNRTCACASRGDSALKNSRQATSHDIVAVEAGRGGCPSSMSHVPWR